MNLEIASRLVALRKENNLSQEALAEKLGISRQAVSKWERAEASPDTDNLIALAKLYHVSLDELLKIHDEEYDAVAGWRAAGSDAGTGSGREIGADGGTDGWRTAEGDDGTAGGRAAGVDSGTDKWQEAESGCDADGGQASGAEQKPDSDYVHVGFDGIHVKDQDGEVHVGWRGIHVHDTKNGDEVDIDKDGIRVNGDAAKNHIFARGNDTKFPIGIIVIIAYIMLGVCFGLWHPGWLIFFLVPIVETLIHAVRERNPDLFAYPVLTALVFLYVGLVYYIWHPTWVVFLTIPIYYSITGYIRRTRTKDVEEEQEKQG